MARKTVQINPVADDLNEINDRLSRIFAIADLISNAELDGCFGNTLAYALESLRDEVDLSKGLVEGLFKKVEAIKRPSLEVVNG